MIKSLHAWWRNRRPDLRTLTIGYMPTLDAATLIVAQERGYFSDQQLNVRLVQEKSWSQACDHLISGQTDASHLPGTTPLCAQLGIRGEAAPLRTALVLSLGGSAFGLATHLAAELGQYGTLEQPLTVARALAAMVVGRKERGEAPLRLAVTSPTSIGSYDLRYWLAAGGVDPNVDVELVATAPSRMLHSLRGQRCDGAWLDEPYATFAADEGLVNLLVTKHEFWNNSLGKVLTVTEAWRQAHESTHLAMLRALIQAGQWVEQQREETADLLAQRHYLNMDAAVIRRALCGPAAGGIAFARGAAQFPWYSQPVWYLGQIVRWGDYAQVLDFKKTAQSVYLPSVYRDAARQLGHPYPTIGYKDEGVHSGSWWLDDTPQPIEMGSDMFFDRRRYEPRKTMAYLKGLEISHIRAPLDAMWAIR